MTSHDVAYDVLSLWDLNCPRQSIFDMIDIWIFEMQKEDSC